MSFWFQFKFRHESVEYAYMKEIICSLILVVIFQYINFEYLNLFSSSTYSSLATTDLMRAKIK